MWTPLREPTEEFSISKTDFFLREISKTSSNWIIEIGYQFFSCVDYFKFTCGDHGIRRISVTGARIIREVAVIAAPFAARAGYHAIGDCDLRVAVKATTSAYQAG